MHVPVAEGCAAVGEEVHYLVNGFLVLGKVIPEPIPSQLLFPQGQRPSPLTAA